MLRAMTGLRLGAVQFAYNLPAGTGHTHALSLHPGAGSSDKGSECLMSFHFGGGGGGDTADLPGSHYARLWLAVREGRPRPLIRTNGRQSRVLFGTLS